MKKIKILQFLFSFFLLAFLAGCAPTPIKSRIAAVGKTEESPSLSSVAQSQSEEPTKGLECTRLSGGDVHKNTFIWHGSGGESLPASGSIINGSMRQQERKASIDHAPTDNTIPVKASYYAERFHGRKTFTGERFNIEGSTAAILRLKLPMHTVVRLRNPANGRVVDNVLINDTGSNDKRDIDVSRGIARKLGFVRAGLAMLEMQIISLGEGS